MIRIIQQRRTRWTGHVERIGGRGGGRNAYRILVVKLQGKRPLLGIDVDRGIKLKYILEK
jgi:hypothetical protein